MILMLPIFDVIANDVARYKRNELEFYFLGAVGVKDSSKKTANETTMVIFESIVRYVWEYQLVRIDDFKANVAKYYCKANCKLKFSRQLNVARYYCKQDLKK